MHYTWLSLSWSPVPCARSLSFTASVYSLEYSWSKRITKSRGFGLAKPEREVAQICIEFACPRLADISKLEDKDQCTIQVGALCSYAVAVSKIISLPSEIRSSGLHIKQTTSSYLIIIRFLSFTALSIRTIDGQVFSSCARLRKVRSQWRTIKQRYATVQVRLARPPVHRRSIGSPIQLDPHRQTQKTLRASRELASLPSSKHFR